MFRRAVEKWVYDHDPLRKVPKPRVLLDDWLLGQLNDVFPSVDNSFKVLDDFGSPSDYSAEIDGLKILTGNVQSVTQAIVTSPASCRPKTHSILDPGELQRLVDSIDKVGLSSDDRFLHHELMVKIMSNTSIIPTRLQLHDVVQSPHPAMMTAGTNVYKGVSNGNPVALKKPRHHSRAEGPGAIPADLYGEYYTLSMLEHAHVLPALGICVDPHDFLPAGVSPYMPNGTICDYLENHPDADRLRLLADVASGINYLHNLPNPVVHRDIRSANIMVNAEGKAVVIDLGSSLVLKPGAAHVSSNDGSRNNPRWTALEVLRPTHPVTTKVDVWSFACLAIEVFSGKKPFDDIIRDGAVVIEVVVKNRRPSRPQGVPSARQLNDSLWTLMERSWNLDPKDRPSMSDFCLLLNS